LLPQACRDMSERAAGYVTDVGYTYGYHAALNPLASRLAFLRAGLVPPAIATACELGFGQGVSLCLHAAASPVRWWGCDLLPEHVAFAKALDAASGAGAVLAEATFAEFAERDDLPRFDFIGLHGVLSWVSADNRARIAAFVDRQLATGGVLYTGYNALPGWSELLPLRRLMAEHARRAGAGGTLPRIEATLDFATRLLEVHPLALRGSPGLGERFQRLRQADRRYLAHEYFNRDWDPLYFADVAELLAAAGLRHACSARLRDHLDELNLTAGQRHLLGEITDPCLRETARDFMANTQLRRDYWVRERRTLDPGALAEAWRQTRLVLTVAPAQVAERVTGPQGELRLDGPDHRALLALLVECGPLTLGEAEQRLPGQVLHALAEAAFQLAACGYLAPAQDQATIAACEPRVRRLNAHLQAHAVGEAAITVRASAVTGGGVEAGSPLA